MEWIDTLFVEHTALQAVVVVALICAAGMALGKVRIGGISLGVTFVFFVGILAGHFGLSVDEEMLEMAVDDAKSLLADTFLADKPVIPVSAYTGAGIEELKKALQRMTETADAKSRKGAFFLPVDRAFHISGFGTVVTGTAINGEVREGDEVEVMPRSFPSKVRSIQVHGAPVSVATAGQRVAVNLAGISLSDVGRGDVVTAKDCFTASKCLDVSIRLLPSAEPLKHWQRLRLHVGTTDTVTRVSLLDREQILPGESAAAQLITEDPVVASMNSCFIS